MDFDKKRLQYEKRALNLSLFGGVTFLIVEFIMAIITNSQAILMDSAYDAAELIMIVLSLRIIPLLYRPATEKHPYGYSQIESLFIVIKGFMLAAVTIGLVINNIQIFIQGGRHISFSLVAYFELFATFLSLFVITGLKKINKVVESPLVDTEINGWTIDSFASLGIAIAFFLPSIIHTAWMEQLLPYLDQIIAIILSLFILPVPVRTILTGLRDLFLLAPDEETMDEIKSIVEDILEEYDFERITYDVVKTGRKIWISVYVIPRSDLISVSNISKIQSELENALQEVFSDLYFELLPDID